MMQVRGSVYWETFAYSRLHVAESSSAGEDDLACDESARSYVRRRAETVDGIGIVE